MKTLRYCLLALVAAGCPQPTKLVLPNPPVIDKFTASPNTVARGGMVTLEWSTADATEVEIVHVGVGPLAGVDNKATGAVMVAVNAQALFVLNAANARGVKTTAIATATVEGGAQQIMFAALPNITRPGEAVTLVWTAPGARAVTVSPEGGMAIDLRGQVETGSVEVTPTAATRYVLSADGVTRTVDITLTQLITSFTASKSLADAGESVTLTWQTANATKVTLNQPGRGTLFTSTDGGMMIDTGSVTDSLPVYEAGTIVPYQLTVEGAGPPITQTASIVIGSLPAITSFAGPEYAKIGSRFQLRWTTLNADTVELSANGAVFYRTLSPAEAASGVLQLDAAATSTDYTLAAVNTPANVRVTRTWRQEVIGAASVTTFTVLPSTVANGGDPVTLTWNVPNARRVNIVDSTGHSVASARGPTAEMGTGTAYPNGPTTYTLTADNTVDPAVTADAGVTVTTPASFGATGTLFANNPFTVSWTVGGGQGLQGYPSPVVDVKAVSTGFVDISDGGTRLPFAATANDAVLSFTPPDFETFMWGTRVAGPFTVSTNGFVVLGPTAATRATTTAMPNTTIERNFLAAFWANLSFGPDTGIYWQVVGEAPERTLIVQFDHMHAPAAAGADLVFEVKVHQTGVVTYEYKTLANLGTLVPLTGVQGPPNEAVVGPAPTAGGSLGFLGPIDSPITATLTAPTELGGFIKLTNGYLLAKYTPSGFVRQNEISLTEVMFSPSPAIAATGEWFEVSNRSTVPVDLAGWTVDIVGTASFVIDAGLTVAPGSSVLLGQISRDAGNDDVATSFAYGPQFAMSDDAGTIALFVGAYRSQGSWNAGPDAGGNAGGVGVSVNTDSQGHRVIGDTASTPPHPITCSSRTPFGSQAPQQLGSPGTFAPCIAAMSSIPVSYFDISATGTPIFSTDFDQAVAAVNISSAPFSFQGGSVTDLTVSTNGWLILKTYTGTFADGNKTVPTTGAPSGSVVSPFWDDLENNTLIPSANTFFKRVAASEDPANPAPHWIIQWHHWSHFFADDDLNFQVKLFDSGVIEYHYAAMTSNTTSLYGNGNSATVWLENVAGNTALISSVNQPVVVPNSAIRFTP